MLRIIQCDSGHDNDKTLRGGESPTLVQSTSSGNSTSTSTLVELKFRENVFVWTPPPTFCEGRIHTKHFRRLEALIGCIWTCCCHCFGPESAITHRVGSYRCQLWTTTQLPQSILAKNFRGLEALRRCTQTCCCHFHGQESVIYRCVSLLQKR